MKSNDEKILELKAKIAEKKAITSPKAFSPITNMSIERLDGVRINLNTLTPDGLTLMMVKLNSYLMSAKELKIDVSISGYLLQDWISDIRQKLAVVVQREETQKLKEYEKKLSQLLSDDKKVELELNDIENFIK